MNGDDHPTLPPVRLPTEAEMARDALAAPLIVRAVTLARWAGEGKRVGAGGELLGDQLESAAEHLGLIGEDGPPMAAEAWNLAVDIELLDVTEDEPADEPADEAENRDGPAVPDLDAVATAVAGADLEVFTTGDPAEVLDLWQDAFETVLADAAMPNLEDLLDNLTGSAADGQIDPDNLDLSEFEWDPEAEADFLESALGNLYLLTVNESEGETDELGPLVPLPVLAASLALPEDVGEPTEEMLAEVSGVMMRLDEQFRILEPTGVVEFHPVDETLIAEAESGEVAELDESEEDITRYGMVRLTPLGLYGVRAQMLDAGLHAPMVGELVEEDAETLLPAVVDYPESAALAELTRWLGAREPLPAVRELLTAARGEDASAPRRRLLCQQTLSLVDREVEPALREVLDDSQLGGLARVWLAERGATDVPAPSEDMVFWLTVDTFAAQLEGQPGSEATEELQDLMRGLVDQHSGFFEKVWRVPHPATAEVLDAMGRLHPDRQAAKEAKKAAYRARSKG